MSKTGSSIGIPGFQALRIDDEAGSPSNSDHKNGEDSDKTPRPISPLLLNSSPTVEMSPRDHGLRIPSSEWAFSSGEDFNFEEDFEVAENELELGQEATSSLRMHDKIDEDDEELEALDFFLGDEVQVEAKAYCPDMVTNGFVTDTGINPFESQKTPALTRVPLRNGVAVAGWSSSGAAISGGDVSEDSHSYFGASDIPGLRNESSGGSLSIGTTDHTNSMKPSPYPPAPEINTNHLAFSAEMPRFLINPASVSSVDFKLTYPQLQQPQQQQQLFGRSRRVPTLPSLPLPKTKEKNFFGDFFGSSKNNNNKKNESKNNAESEGPDALDKMKTKISSAFNNVKYGWTIKTKTQFKTNSAIWLLGQMYLPVPDPNCSSDEEAKAASSRVIDKFKSDFTSRIWFTYRREFPVLSGSNLTSDCGWGCMLRSAQMMLAQCFVVHFMGRSWRLFDPQDRKQEAFHRQIIKWFGDSPSDLSPFSVHRLVKVGRTLGKKAGDWYGPSSVAYIAREAMLSAYSFNPLLGQIKIYVAKDCTIYIPDVHELCRRKPTSFSSSCESTSEDRSILPYHLNAKEFSQKAKAARKASQLQAKDEDEWQTALLLLVPVRLGGETLNEAAYMDCLKSMLALKQSCGIIGGRPRHSLYFIGWQEDRLIHLDPHYCQDVVEFSEREFPVHTFHCVSPRKMLFSKMDPSCTFGFYLRTRAEFDQFMVDIDEILHTQPDANYPMFVFSEERMEDVENEALGGYDFQNDFVIDAVSGERAISRTSDHSTEDDYVLL